MADEILKYKLFLTTRQTLTLHKDAQILDVQPQNGELCLWATSASRLVSSEHSRERTILMLPTGQAMPDDTGRYITTIQLLTPDKFDPENNAPDVLVIHVFEAKTQEG